MSKPRDVLDTNLIVSAALLEHSFSRQVFEKALLFGEILISDQTQYELSEVLTRQKFACYVSEENGYVFLANFISIATSIRVDERIDVCRDPKDNKFLELAVSGNAECIITGR